MTDLRFTSSAGWPTFLLRRLARPYLKGATMSDEKYIMRRHKFRGLTKVEKKWVYGSLIQSSDFTRTFIGYALCASDGVVYINYDEVLPASVGEFTGKRTREFPEGQEVCEGDYIYFSISKTQHFRGIVVWSDTRCGWSVEIAWEKADVLGQVSSGYEFEWTNGNRRLATLDTDCFDIKVITPRRSSFTEK